MKKKNFFLPIILLWLVSGIFGQATALNTVSGFDPNYKIVYRDAVQDKNFYLLSLLQNEPKVRKLLRKNRTLLELSNRHKNDFRQAEKCGDVNCYDKIFRLTDEEITSVAKIFEAAPADLKLTKLVDTKMRPSGIFIKYNEQSDAEMLAAAWRDAARGINRLLDVYGLGQPPQYKDIDSVTYDVTGAEYRQKLKTGVGQLKTPKDVLFFEPTLDYALKLLEINRRNEAARHEPLERTENKKAFENLKNVNWSDYPYTVILVLGSGPNAQAGDAPNIGKIGMERADAAAGLFKEKKAPLIILSGGYVHPAQTPYCEALEMKKYIMQKYGIAEESIFIDPHARHTTTNIRNAGRIMFRDGIPTDKKALVTSSPSHIDYVIGEQFAKRNMDELGFVPMRMLTRISPVAVEFLPLPVSLFMNSLDPLDP